MIDIHCHILPGIDDGAKTIEDSLEMLKKAKLSGVTDIVLTPHYMWGTVYNADNVKKWKLYQELCELADKENLGINLYLGNEIYIDERLPKMLKAYTGEPIDEDEKKAIYELATLNSTKYVLVEFPVQVEDKSAKRILSELVKMGLKPIIAHPERYLYIQQDISKMDEYVQIGCLLQGDYLALTGKYGRMAEKTLRLMLKKDMVFCLASDLHKPVDDYKLKFAKKKLLRVIKSPEKMKMLLVDNPKLVITR